MVNQIERHPLNQNVELREWEAEYNVVPEAWAPFGEGRGGLFENPALAQIAPLDTKTSSFFSHSDPAMIQWFANIVEERKSNHDCRQDKKNW